MELKHRDLSDSEGKEASDSCAVAVKALRAFVPELKLQLKLEHESLEVGVPQVTPDRRIYNLRRVIDLIQLLPDDV